MPKSFFSQKNELFLYIIEYSETEYIQHLVRQDVNRVILTPFHFLPSFYSTKEIGSRWRAYHAKEFLEVAKLSQYLTNDFSLL